MKEEYNDITTSIISEADIRRQIGTLFPDSVILDNRLNFISISQNILKTIGYTSDELQGMPVSQLSATIQELIKEKLKPGYFAEERFEVRSNIGDTIPFGVSGFYLGLIAEVNGLIVLKFRNLDELSKMQSRLDAKTLELDLFVYHSAHALRGPLATLKGLINLARINKDPEEMNFLLRQMDLFAGKLDDKLHRLIYFSESDKGNESALTLTLQSVCDALVANIQEGSVDRPVQFHCSSLDRSQVFKNGETVLCLLRNLVLFFCQQPKVNNNHLRLETHSSLDSLEFVLRAKGFLLSNSLTEKLSNTNLGYSEILHHPELINLYAAKKIVLRLKGEIQFTITPQREVIVSITILCNNSFR